MLIGRRQVRAFSLIELLVVLAIIALLTGLLLPVLSAARDHARQLKCLTQLRSVGLMQSLYAQDHAGWFTPTGPTQQFGGNGSAPDGVGKGWIELLVPYNDANTLLVYNCPQLPEPTWVSYFLTSRWVAGVRTVRAVRQSDMTHASSWLMAGDCTRQESYAAPLGLGFVNYDDVDKDDAGDNSFRFDEPNRIALHGDINNAVFGDGHAQAVTADALGSSVTFDPTRPGIRWEDLPPP